MSNLVMIGASENMPPNEMATKTVDRTRCVGNTATMAWLSSMQTIVAKSTYDLGKSKRLTAMKIFNELYRLFGTKSDTHPHEKRPAALNKANSMTKLPACGKLQTK